MVVHAFLRSGSHVVRILSKRAQVKITVIPGEYPGQIAQVARMAPLFPIVPFIFIFSLSINLVKEDHRDHSGEKSSYYFVLGKSRADHCADQCRTISVFSRTTFAEKRGL